MNLPNKLTVLRVIMVPFFVFLVEMEFDRLGVFTYSPEEDKPAATMTEQIPEEVKEDRQAELMELQQEIAFDQCGTKRNIRDLFSKLFNNLYKLSF